MDQSSVREELFVRKRASTIIAKRDDAVEELNRHRS